MWAAVVVAFGIGSICGDLVLLRVRPRHAFLAVPEVRALPRVDAPRAP